MGGMPAPPQWGVDLKTGQIVDGEAENLPATQFILPDDYQARRDALEFVARIAPGKSTELTRDFMNLFHRFLVNAPTPQPKTFTDE